MTLNYPLHIPTLSYEEALEYVSLRYDNLGNINYNLICQYPDICEIATQQYPKALKFVPVNLQPKFSLNCIQRYPYGVCYIPKIQRTFNLCVTAIEQLNQALGRTETQHILHAIFHSTAVDLSTIDSNNPYHIAIYFIKTPKKQQNNLQLLKNFITTSTKHLVKIISPYISTNLIKQLPVEDMSKTRTLQNIANNILYTTYEQALKYVTKNGILLQFVDNKLKYKHADLCEIAIQQHPEALRYIPCDLKPKYSLNCIQRNTHVISLIPKKQRTIEICATVLELNLSNTKKISKHFLKYFSKITDLTTTIDSNNPYHIATYFLITLKKQQNQQLQYSMQLLKKFTTSSLIEIISPYISINLVDKLPFDDLPLLININAFKNTIKKRFKRGY